MRTILFIIILLCSTAVKASQEHSIIGAWYWSNSTKEVSIFIKKNGSIEVNSRKKGEAIIDENSKTGNYSKVNNLITITWKDNSKENYKINFTDKDRFVVHDLGAKGKLVFNRVVDEEVIVKPM